MDLWVMSRGILKFVVRAGLDTGYGKLTWCLWDSNPNGNLLWGNLSRM